MPYPERKSHVPHFLFLPVLFGFLPHDREYVADNGRWAEAIWNLRQQFNEKYPELFRDLTFNREKGFRAYSPEVSQLLLELQAGAVIRIFNPGFLQFDIRPHEQEEMWRSHQEDIDGKHLAGIKELAEALAKDENLHVPDTIDASENVTS